MPRLQTPHSTEWRSGLHPPTGRAVARSIIHPCRFQKAFEHIIKRGFGHVGTPRVGRCLNTPFLRSQLSIFVLRTDLPTDLKYQHALSSLIIISRENWCKFKRGTKHIRGPTTFSPLYSKFKLLGTVTLFIHRTIS